MPKLGEGPDRRSGALSATATLDRNPARLLDVFPGGRYFIKVFDIASNRLIFSQGFDSYYGEYRTTAPAKKGIKRAYHESALIPYPKRPVFPLLPPTMVSCMPAVMIHTWPWFWVRRQS